MAETIVMPQAGNSVESCIVLSWRVSKGDTIAVGDVVCEIETDKATIDVEATAGGTVLQLLAEEGDEVPVKDPLLVVGEPGESVDTASDPGTTIAAEAAAGAPQKTAGDPGATIPVRSQTIVPSATTGTARVSPRARKRAGDLGVDPTVLQGSGPGGRVLERDVLAAAEMGTAAVASVASSSGAQLGGQDTGDEGTYDDVSVSGVRKTIAQRMHASLQESAQLTLQRRADARSVLAYRARVKEERRRLGTTASAAASSIDASSVVDEQALPNITINDMVNFAVSRVLPQYPEINAHFLGTSIRRFHSVDLGFAVDTPKGLLVPTLRNAQTKSLAAIARESAALAERAIAGRASSEDLAPATFTITNLGGLGIEWFTPVLNTPQVGILGVGTIVQGYNPDGEVVPQIALSLTIDHRAIDGAPAARFLAEVAQSIATFDLTLAK